MKLIDRNILKNINKFLDSDEVIVLHGARQVGKTSILKIIQNKLNKSNKFDNYYVDLEDLRILEVFNSGYKQVIKFLKERGFLKKKLYLLVDEIQYLSHPSNLLKLLYDHYKDKIKLIVSGSSSFEIRKKFKDSLVGRTVNFNIYPLNFEEFLIFKKSKFNLESDLKSNKTIEDLTKLYKEYVLYGGYPKIVLESDIEKKEIYLQQIIDTYIRKDIKDLADIKDILKFNNLLEILASQTGNLLNVSELANTSKLSRPTVENYLFLMENTYIIKLVYPYSTNLRSELFKTPKIYFYDTGIVNLLWFKTLPKKILGNIFETAVFSELIKFNVIDKINFWRTQDKKEIDFIISIANEIFPIEVKYNLSKLKLTSLRYFLRKYNVKEKYIIALHHNKKINEIINLYPWEIYKTLKKKY